MFNIKPADVLIYSWCIWFFFYLLSPYQYTHLGSIFAPILLLLCYNIAFFIGLNSKKKNVIKRKPILFTPIHLKTLNIALLLGFIGSILNIYVKLNLIASLSISSLTNNKEQIIEAGELAGGGLSIISSLLYPMCYVAFIMLIFFRGHLSKRKLFFSFFIAILPVITIVLLGSRTTLFFYALTGLFAFLISPKKSGSQKLITLDMRKMFHKVLNPKVIVTSAIALILFVAFFSLVQSDRLVQMGGDDISFFENWKWTQQWRYNDDHPINMFFKDHNPLNNVILLNFIHYIVHGVFEYIRLFNHVDNSFGVYYGSYEFYIFLKFFNFLGLDVAPDYFTMNQVVYKQGVYTTFWGPFFIDFGILGIPIIYFIGRYAKNLYYKFIQGSFLGIIAYPYVLTIVLTSSIFHVFSGSYLYNVTSIIFVNFLFKTLNKKEQKLLSVSKLRNPKCDDLPNARIYF